MKYYNISIGKFFLFLACISTLSVFPSCSEDEHVGEYKLTGNIKNLIPEYSYSIECTTSSDSNGTKYLAVTPELDSNFDYWGLVIKRVEYYIDNALVKTIDASPFELTYPTTEIGTGNHTIMAKITIGGEECEDAVLEKSDIFTIAPSGETSETTADFYFDYNHVEKGGILHITPQILEERSPEGSKITKVEYYWDDKLVDTQTESPFTWDYQVNDDAGTEHQIRVNIQYKDNYHPDRSFSWSFSNYKVMDSNDCHYWWKMKSTNKEYKNGEIVQSIAKVDKGKENNDIHSFKLYYDGDLIAESSTFPYEINYKLTNQSTGSHTFKHEWTVKKSNGTNYTTSQNEKIIVIP